ncbi:hypothetical protein Q9S36_08950 [Microbacterium sp. ARD31]|uniref:hypothetical protein n=1 Tax=Microbacterium sp. ARD31 TaxID=2962576 RepID=UPI002881CAFD|nr:hypothetical protein [Microbacterium sp. ARD31]MDT0180333.1 hypothetical protein [Microbacterium sp. ARD31]
MSEDARRSRLVMIALLATVALVVVVALIVVFTRGGAAQFDEDTPEGVVQRYSQAVVEGDTRTALEYLPPDVAEYCERVTPGTEDRRVTLLQTTERDDSARVEVLIATVYGTGPLGSDEYETEGVFELVAADGGWLIETAPWELAICFDSAAQ